MNRKSIAVLAGGGIICLAALPLALVAKENNTFPTEAVVLAQAAQECDSAGLEFSPTRDTVTLIVDGGSPYPIDCMMDTLEISPGLEEQIMSTTGLVGRQTAEDGDYTWSWSYSGFNGFSGTITPTE